MGPPAPALAPSPSRASQAACFWAAGACCCGLSLLRLRLAKPRAPARWSSSGLPDLPRRWPKFSKHRTRRRSSAPRGKEAFFASHVCPEGLRLAPGGLRA